MVEDAVSLCRFTLIVCREQSPEKLLQLVDEINRLLEANGNPARDRFANVNPETARLVKQKQALLKDG